MKKIKFVVAIAMLGIMLMGCTEQTMTKEFGGSMKVVLPAGEKLEEVTWKDNNLWYLTRPMRDDEVAETHTFQEYSEYHVWEGTVVIEERNK